MCERSVYMLSGTHILCEPFRLYVEWYVHSGTTIVVMSHFDGYYILIRTGHTPVVCLSSPGPMFLDLDLI